MVRGILKAFTNICLMMITKYDVLTRLDFVRLSAQIRTGLME